jgi:hypothetical protein
MKTTPHSLARSTKSLALTLTAGLALAVAAGALAADSAEPKTLLAERGKLLLSDDLNAAPSKEWRAAKGKWEPIDGAWHGEEVPADMHPAVIRHPLKFQDAIFQFSFQLNGAKQATLSINDEKEHLARVLIRPNGFTVQKDDHDHDGPDKAVVFQNVTTPIQPGEWHTLVVEILGQDMLATLDGEKTGYGAHEMIASPKANFGFTIGGQSASFKNLRVWEALPNKDWTENKAKLAATPPK